MTGPEPRRALREEESSAGSASPASPARRAEPTVREGVSDSPNIAPGPSGDYLSHRQILVVLSGLMAGMFLAALDQSIVGVALPRITSELGGLDKLSWVV
ncbi:MAG TPA: hypothetical protein VN609_04370, partial [Propionibacteriaceae bacterium]|nr:hypothetical protein [Propionibacteriaceae bacterium]